MTPEVKVRRTDVHAPGLPDGALYSISTRRNHLTLRIPGTSSYAFVDSWEFTEPLDERTVWALVTRAVSLARVKHGLRIVVPLRDTRLVDLLRQSGFRHTAPVEAQRTELTHEFM